MSKPELNSPSIGEVLLYHIIKIQAEEKLYLRGEFFSTLWITLLFSCKIEAMDEASKVEGG